MAGQPAWSATPKCSASRRITGFGSPTRCESAQSGRLGAFRPERVLAGLDDAQQRTDGVLWVGPLGSALAAAHGPARARQADMAARAQRCNAGAFGADAAALTAPGAPRPEARIVHLQNSSDPII